MEMYVKCFYNNWTSLTAREEDVEGGLEGDLEGELEEILGEKYFDGDGGGGGEEKTRISPKSATEFDSGFEEDCTV